MVSLSCSPEPAAEDPLATEADGVADLNKKLDYHLSTKTSASIAGVIGLHGSTERLFQAVYHGVLACSTVHRTHAWRWEIRSTSCRRESNRAAAQLTSIPSPSLSECEEEEGED